jgi:hypothetical protein
MKTNRTFVKLASNGHLWYTACKFVDISNAPRMKMTKALVPENALLVA